MTEPLCGTCLEPLPDGAAACAFCGTPRPAPPGRLSRLAERASRLGTQVRGLSPRVVAAIVALILLTTLTPVAWRLSSGGDAAPSPTPVSTAARGDEPRPADQLFGVFPVERLPADVTCMVADRSVPGRECAHWALGVRGDTFTHVAAEGDVLVAATLDGVVRLDPRTGATLWAWRDPQSRARRRAATGLHLAGRRAVLVREADHRVLVLDVTTGDVAWDVELAERRIAWVTVTRGRPDQPAALVVREPTRLTVRRLDHGEELFTEQVQGGGTTSAVSQGIVVAVSGQTLTARDLLTGAPRWSTAVERNVLSVTLASRETVAVAEADGVVRGVSVVTGRERWRAQVPGLREVVPLGDGRVAAVTDFSVQVLLAAGGVPAPLPTQFTTDARTAGPGELLLAVGPSVKRFSVDLQGETWSLHSHRPIALDATTVFDGPSGPAVVTALGSQLVAFDARPDLADARGCRDARQSEAMGTLPAWRNDLVHVAVGPAEQGNRRQVWVGLPGFPPREGFTLSALHQETGLAAVFRRLDTPSGPEEWTTTITMRDGARSSAGWPTHWALHGQFPPGCWVFLVDSPEASETVVVPVE